MAASTLARVRLVANAIGERRHTQTRRHNLEPSSSLSRTNVLRDRLCSIAGMRQARDSEMRRSGS